MKKNKSNKKVLATVLAVFTVIFAVIFAGCYNVLYEILERANELEDDETVKTLIGIDSFENVQNADGSYLNLAMKCTEDPTSTGASTGGKNSLPYSYKYRIPVVVVLPPNAVLPNGQKLGAYGRIYVTGDDRFGDTAFGGGNDLPQKASAWGRFSDDNGKTWSNMQMIAHFDDLDMSTFQKSNVNYGVTTGDPSIGRTKDNYLIVLSTFGPPRAGSSSHGGGHNSGWQYFEEDNKTYIILRQNTEVYDFPGNNYVQKQNPSVNVAAAPRATSDSSFAYAVPVEGGEIINKSTKQGVGLWADEYYRVWTDKDMTQPLRVPRLKNSGSDDKSGKSSFADVTVDNNSKTQAHLFMIMSPFIAWRGCEYTGMSISSDGGITWTPHKDITYMVRPKTKQDGWWFGSPCGGLLIENGKYAGRTIFSAYSQKQDVAMFYTEDNGKTWKCSDYVNGTFWRSETSIVDITGSDDIIAISRGPSPQYAISSDGGDTWKSLDGIPNFPYSCSNELISVTPLRKTVGPNNEPLVAFSSGDTASGIANVGRAIGKIHIAAIKHNGTNWYFDFNFLGSATTCDLNPGGWFVYSCIREMSDGNLIDVWETDGCDTSHRVSFIYLNRE